MQQPLTCLLLFLFLFVSCDHPKKNNDSKKSPQQFTKPFVLMDEAADSIPTGRAIGIQGIRLDPTNLIPPKKVPAKAPRQKLVANNQKFIELTKVVPFLSASIDKFTPGNNGLALPDTLELNYKTVQMLPPTRKTALPPTFKASGTQNIKSLDVSQGLNSAYIYKIIEDQQGYFWLTGIVNGLVRYDGHAFTTFMDEEGILEDGNNQIVDQNGAIWLSLDNGNTAKFDGKELIVYTDLYATRILLDKKGILWFTTAEAGLITYDGQHFLQYSIPQGLDADVLIDISEAADGTLWMTGKQLISWDGVSFTMYHQSTLDSTDRPILLPPRLESSIWYTTSNGFCQFDRKTFKHYDLEHTNGIFYRDSKDNIWFNQDLAGINKFDGNSVTNYGEKEGFNQQSSNYILEDTRGNLWTTFHGKGLQIITPHSFKNWTKADGLPGNITGYFAEDENQNIWIATDGFGIIKYDGTYFNYYAQAEGLNIQDASVVLADSRGDIWVTSYSGEGVTRFDGTYFYHYTNAKTGMGGGSNWAMAEDNQGNIWFGAENGIITKFDGATFTHFGEQFKLPSIVAILEDSQQNLWWATEGAGVLKYQQDSLTFLTTNEELSNNNVTSLLEDRQGNLWFGTIKGLNCYDGQKMVTLTTADGLPSNVIYNLQEDSLGNIWAGTHYGIALLELAEIGDFMNAKLPILPKIKVFNQADGLKDITTKENAVLLDSKQQLWWATGKGINTLDLRQFYTQDTPYIPQIHLNNIMLNDQYVDFALPNRHLDSTLLDKKLLLGTKKGINNYPISMSLPYDVNHLTFEMAALDWNAPHAIQYQYQLEGLENTWSKITPKNTIDYRGLPYGHYTFKARAQGRSQIWNEPFSYAFTIRPPWWHSNLAYFGYCCLFAGLMYSIFATITRQLRLQNKLKLEQLEANRLKELDSFKTKLYTNLTHEFRTPLTVIMGMADQIHAEPKRFLKDGLLLIRRNGQNLLQLINQLLDLSKLENNAFQLQYQQADIIPYLQYLTESFHSTANGRNLSLRFFSSVEHLVMDYDVEQIKQIMTNLISNALKFTVSGGNVMVRVQQSAQELKIEVEDNGIGIAEKDIPHLFDRFFQVDGSITRKREGTGIGLSHTKELVKLMKGQIEVQSKLGKGSSFIVILPINNTAQLIEEVKAVSEIEIAQNGNGRVATPLEVISFEENKPSNGQHPQLLIIEDNPDVVIYLKSCLSDFYQLDIAYNGKIGIDKALENIPDLIISDVMMPEKDGFEVCDTLKNEARTSHIPFILLTAKADVTSKIAGLKRGADAYLSKPFNKEELLVRLEALLKKRQQLQQYFSQKESTTVNEDIPTLDVETQVSVAIENEFLQKVNAILEKHYGNNTFGLPQLCQRIGMSRSQLFRKLKALVDTSPSAYIRSFRLQKAKALLEQRELNVSEVAWETGFVNLAHFSKVFQEEFGVAPSSIG